MRIVFAGTPSAAVPSLRALNSSDHEVVGVITRPPARQGRSKRLVSSPVAAAAEELGLTVLETTTPSSDDSLQWLSECNAELGVVVAYGALLRPVVLDALPHGWLNLHFSKLPAFRGAAPVQHAVLRREAVIGTTVFQLDQGMDTGPVLSVEEHLLPVDWTSGDLLDQLAEVGARQLVQAVDLIGRGQAVFTPQDEDSFEVSLAPKLVREDGFIGFQDAPEATAARTRAVTPSPGAWTVDWRGQTMKLGPVTVAQSDGSLAPGEIQFDSHEVLVGCGNGAVRLSDVAPAGRKWMPADAWARGARPEPSDALGARYGN